MSFQTLYNVIDLRFEGKIGKEDEQKWIMYNADLAISL